MHWLLRWNPYTYGVTMIIWSTFLRFLACSSIIEEICMLSTRAFGYHPHSRKACWNSTSFFLGSPNVSLEKKQQFFFEKWRSWKNVFFRILRLKWHLLHEILISRRRKRKQVKELQGFNRRQSLRSVCIWHDIPSRHRELHSAYDFAALAQWAWHKYHRP